MAANELRKELREATQRMKFHREEKERHHEAFKRYRLRRTELIETLREEQSAN